MKINVKLFAVAKQLAGCDELSIDLPEPATVGQLRQALVAQVPELASVAGQLQFAIDAEYASNATPIPPTADVACIPPVSGG